ncbi:acyltransferase family protein [Catenovulum adriaticum]|uniref:Heparan-alpha-glucosaminide N-acetyltransferase domain-containing protein n=1 Tax=Catenovulum adriaticum TaxID=2984846 RepID=A0ABY7AP18_9ALTE|nr:acyltransferase family protein [Catenovulum sp. TS8]WAJ70973.1 heparan-alpha-glucosaminide N-acetyltransferase domain-containing protein [Catenovulum sp. TS8]
MARITWLDSCRGMAILLLIAIHYIGALESRAVISLELLEYIQAFLRVATPFFILTFGFTYYVAHRKLLTKNSIGAFYNQKLCKRIAQIFLARQLIVVILAFRFPEQANGLYEILLYQSFSMGGEILTFYLLALIVAPLNIWMLNKIANWQYVLIWLIVYACAYYIGTHFVDSDSAGVLRLLFLDVYPFFPLMFLAAFGMLIGQFYFSVNSNQTRVNVLLPIAMFLLLFGGTGINVISEQPIHDLAIALFKAPPHFLYLSLYGGVTVLLILILAALTEHKLIPQTLSRVLAVVGRNTLIAYVAHYTLYLPSILAKLYKPVIWLEVVGFMVMLFTSFVLIYVWDTYKNNMKSKTVTKEPI